MFSINNSRMIKGSKPLVVDGQDQGVFHAAGLRTIVNAVCVVVCGVRKDKCRDESGKKCVVCSE